VIGYGLGLAVTSRFLWTAPYTNEILDVDTSKMSSAFWRSPVFKTAYCRAGGVVGQH